jgi:hypothetical protein
MAVSIVASLMTSQWRAQQLDYACGFYPVHMALAQARFGFSSLADRDTSRSFSNCRARAT